MGGPLRGVRVVELAGLGAVPFAGMLLADLGADVVRVDRTGPTVSAQSGIDPAYDVLGRGRRSLRLDLKDPDARAALLRLVERSDVLLEGFRPGVAERLGVGPAGCTAVNPRLVYGRMTGWGQSGPLAASAGHDITYLALTGALWAIGRPPDRPVPPLNTVGDFGGGALFLALGVVAALLEARASGRGQVVDAAMVDGAALLTAMVSGLRAQGAWADERGANLLDSGAPFYEVYECADGQYLALGALEPHFYAQLVERTGFDDGGVHQYDRERWPELKHRWAEHLRTRTRDAWMEVLEGSDACAAPVLDWQEAPHHPHLAARDTYVNVGGVVQPAPAPRFERTPTDHPRPPVVPGAHTDEVLTELGYDAAQIVALRRSGATA